VARYPGLVLSNLHPWIAVRAEWSLPRVDLGYLDFEPGDFLHEYFSPDHPFNAFAVFAPDGRLKGWYCNVTYPARIEGEQISWQDLYIDIILCPDGRTAVLDEDELAEAGLEQTDPGLFRFILDARDALGQRIQERAYPFSEHRLPGE
jgi:protein associated with RNAse G/E